jgi:taurine transport system substrate-binding protein
MIAGAAAIENGYLSQEGLNVKPYLFTSGMPMLDALLSGQIQIASIGSVPATIAASRGIAIKVIRIDSLQDGCSVWAQPNSGIKSPADLKGKTIAVTLGTTNHFMLDNVLALGNLTESDVKLVNMEPDDMPSAFKAKAVDAVSIWYPLTWTIQSMGATLIADESMVKEKPFDGTIVQAQFLQQNPEIVVEWLQAVYRAAAWIHQDNETTNLNAATQIYMKYFGSTYTEPFDEAKYEVTYYTHPTLDWEIKNLWTFPNPVAFDMYESVGQFLLKVGRITNVPDPKSFVDLSLSADLYNKTPLASVAIQSANQTIQSAKASGADTSKAESDLKRAEEAYAALNYDNATSLANQARTEALAAEQSLMQTQNNEYLGVATIIVIIVVAAGILFWRRKSSGH